MIPRLAALSIAEINARTFSASALSPVRAPFCMVRNRLRPPRLRNDRFEVCRVRLAADFVFAMFGIKWAATVAGEPDVVKANRPNTS